MLTYKALVLFARCERRVGRLVANLKLRGLGYRVVVGTPHEHDGIANGCVEGEGHVAKNTLRRSNDDSVGCAIPRVKVTGRSGCGGHIHGRRRSIRVHAL